MELIRIAQGELAFGEDSILDKTDLTIKTGERVNG
jgi:ATP-binding cassette subfamily F protein uup